MTRPRYDPTAGFDCGKVPELIRFADGRPFAWLDDHVTWQDGQKLSQQCDCLVLRTAPQRGVEDHHLAALERWIGLEDVRAVP